ncbi:DUF6493 family protein [Lentzea aerocolonigenes]|uniref:DUF6493 family protein n=1 Tax=Lentzea aerocolonigenes TaxID=68170 RepID=UPI0004C3008F|nr:DUF6493 family protein [Lentzea aerocolonigenes]MCP2246023.1 hypothetical protein [Lentzea aerocolonigenes]
MTFDEIRALIEADEPVPLGAALTNVSDRKELAAQLVAYEKQHRAGERSWHHRETLAIAGAGLLQTPSALAPWLIRYQIWHHQRSPHDGIGVVIGLLRDRDEKWLPDLAARLAAKMPTRNTTRHDLLRIVLAFCGENPPDNDGFLLHFMGRGGHVDFPAGYEVLFPRMLEVVGAGAIIANTRQWGTLLRDRADRQVLLDGCLARLQQGGSAKEMEGFLALHEVLEVTQDERAEHARDYVAMLPDSRSTVATLAQDRLKSLDEAGRLDFDLLCDASRWVFGRSEKKLVRAQLTWLGKHAKTSADEVVLVVAELFAHESDDLRGQAVKLVAKHLAKISADTRADLLALAEQLPADLAAQLGGEALVEEAVALAPFTPRPWPEPIATLDELTGEVRALFGRNAGHVDAVTAERIIEAVVRFAWQDRDAVAKAFGPIYDKHPWIQNRNSYYSEHSKSDPWSELIAIIAAVAEPATWSGSIASVLESTRKWLTQLKRTQPGSISDRLALRLREIRNGLVHSPRPALVSPPTEASGLLDADTLLERLAKADAEGWEPWPRDLEQAYQRLPRDVAPEAFASLPGNTGRLLRQWLADRTDPVVALAEKIRTTADYGYYRPAVTEKRLFATVTPGLPAPEQHWYGYGDWGPLIEWWPAVLPAQRDAVAARLVPHFANRLYSKGGSDGPLLPMLAEADGPLGIGMDLALAYGLGAEVTVNRAHAVDALLILASRSQLEGKPLGEMIGLLVHRGELALNRVVPGLRDAARSGALKEIWDALVALLPKLWTHNRVADVIELAVELAQQLKPGGDVDGLAEVAARKGSSKAVVQAKRLVAALS